MPIGAKDMQDRSAMPDESGSLAPDVMESVGMDGEQGNEVTQDLPESPEVEQELPLHAKEKLGKMQKRHERDLRRMRREMDDMRSRFNAQPQSNQQAAGLNYPNQELPASDDDRIAHAVHRAFQMKDEQERKAQEMERHRHVQKEYESLQDRLDNASSKYDDFDEVVRHSDAPYSEAMRDAALLLPNAEDVLYKLGKDKDQLMRISKLQPLEQAKEMVKLSIALMGGDDKKSASPRPLGQVKSTPVSSSQVNDKTSVGDLRRKMKSGSKWL